MSKAILVVTESLNQLVETPPNALRFTPKSDLKLNFNGETFDEVICATSKNVYQECCRVLKIGGEIKAHYCTENDLVLHFEDVKTLDNGIIFGKKLKDYFTFETEELTGGFNYFLQFESDDDELFVDFQPTKKSKNNSGEKKIEEREPVTFADKKIQQIKQVDYHIAYCGQEFKGFGKELKPSKQCYDLHGGPVGKFCYNSCQYKCLVCGSTGTHKEMSENHPHFELDKEATVETEGELSNLNVPMKKYPKPAKVFYLHFKQNNEKLTKFTSQPKDRKGKAILKTETFPTKELDPSIPIDLVVEKEERYYEILEGNVHPEKLKLKRSE
jgi:hypothetical protein